MVSTKSREKGQDDFFMGVTAPFGCNAAVYVPAAEYIVIKIDGLIIEKSEVTALKTMLKKFNTSAMY